MKKILLGTSAIALAGAFAFPASAAEWSVRVGGYMEQHVGYGSSDGDGWDDFSGFDGIDVKSDSEIHFSPSITLDNGIRISARIELEGATASDQVDETYLSIDGSFGTLRLGEDDIVSYNMAYGAPDVSMVNINSGSDTLFWGGEIISFFTSTYPGVTGDPAGIMYYSPRMAGFQIGLSYARDANRSTNDEQIDDEDSDNLNNIWGIGANYSNSFGDASVAASLTYNEGEYGDDGGEDKSWQAGLNVGFGGFTVGGSYAEHDFEGNEERTVYDLGVSYSTGPWAFSLTYIHGQEDEVSYGGKEYDDTGEGHDHGVDYDDRIWADTEIDKFLIAATYTLAQGVRVGAWGIYADAEADNCERVGEDAECFDGSYSEEGIAFGTTIRIDF